MKAKNTSFWIAVRDLTLMLASMITIIGTTAIAPSLPQMANFFGHTPNGDFLVRISMTIPALSAGIFGPLTGFVIDRWGRKRILIAALLLYGISGISGFFLTSLTLILISRFVLGISVAALTTSATALIGDYAHDSKLATSMGRQSLFMAVGNVFFVSFSGVLADINWRLPFLIYTVSLLILPAAIWLVTETRVDRSRANVTSQVTGKENMPKIKTAFVCIIAFINMVVYFMVPVYLPFYVQSFSDGNSVRAGGLLALVGLSWGIVSSQYHRLRKKLTFEWITMLALSLVVVAYVLLSLATGYYVMIVALVMIGLGLGTLLPNMNAWLLSVVPAILKGRAIGMMALFSFLGQFFSPMITEPLTKSVGIASSYLWMGMCLVPLILVCGLVELQQRRLRARQFEGSGANVSQ
ncbi:MFS family permease [Paenibacillus sp. JGP012]|uniref:MFS transporter n=1 Tax=Paenibacillus sp. JGP012 TaxID=2735914 RepID=UPI0016083BB8|nr:MFS transporter [Paenibacillus sp. JGP012]MBB6023384.1 MFS family permease [Paenibacillus sp. JGP012]